MDTTFALARNDSFLASPTEPSAAEPDSRARLSQLRVCLIDLRDRLARASSARSDPRSAQIVAQAIELAESLAEPADEVAELRIGPGGRWFELDGSARVALQRRRALPGILLALASAPGPLSYDALLAAGWPDERVLPQAGELRVRAAISALRALGLRDRLVTTPDGYALEGRTAQADCAPTSSLRK